MKKTILSGVLLTLTSGLYGSEIGDISGKVKFRQVLYSQENGFEPNTGSALGLNLNYKTEEFNGFRGHIGFFFNGPIEQLMDRDGSDKSNDTTIKIAKGYFTDDENEARTVLSSAYLSYKGEDFLLKAGRRAYDQKSDFEKENPMARTKISVVPDLVESYGIQFSGVKGLTIGAEHITKFAYGSRSMPHWGLIGEKGGTAGVIVNPMKHKGNFTNFGELTNRDDTAGITVLSALHKSKGLKLQAWNYFGHDISNILYSQADYSHKINGVKLIYSAQWLNQTGLGDGENSDFKSNLIGLKLTGKYKGFVPSFSLNVSTGDKLYNYLSIDPAFTSSAYSQNAYREEVTAYKFKLAYKFMKQWKTMVSYANYGQSKTELGGKFAPLTDATETDIVLAYKPQKNLVIKFLKAFRTSEYDGVVMNGVKKDRTMDTYRLGVDYTF